MLRRTVQPISRPARGRPVPLVPVVPDTLQPTVTQAVDPAPPVFQMFETAPFAVAAPLPDAPAQPVAPVLSEGALSPRAGVMRGGGLFLRPQWLSYEGARRGLGGLGQSGSYNCNWLLNRLTGEKVPWTGQNWHMSPDSDWIAHCEWEPHVPNTFSSEPVPAPRPVERAPLPGSVSIPPSSPVPSRPPAGGVPVVGPVPGLDNLAPSDWGGEGQDFSAGAQSAPRAGFPWWLLAVAGAVVLS